jgi:hypothetical protein
MSSLPRLALICLGGYRGRWPIRSQEMVNEIGAARAAYILHRIGHVLCIFLQMCDTREM